MGFDLIDRKFQRKCKPAVTVKKGLWWCNECGEAIGGEHVTFEETHDVRSRGGCGKPAVQVAPQ